MKRRNHVKPPSMATSRPCGVGAAPRLADVVEELGPEVVTDVPLSEGEIVDPADGDAAADAWPGTVADAVEDAPEGAVDVDDDGLVEGSEPAAARTGVEVVDAPIGPAAFGGGTEGSPADGPITASHTLVATATAIEARTRGEVRRERAGATSTPCRRSVAVPGGLGRQRGFRQS